MKEFHDILRRPIVTEKSAANKELANQVTFEVAPSANKIEIRQAVESIFKVKVLQVRTINFMGKRKRVGRVLGQRSDWKKAIVTLAPGEKVEFFEGA